MMAPWMLVPSLNCQFVCLLESCFQPSSSYLRHLNISLQCPQRPSSDTSSHLSSFTSCKTSSPNLRSIALERCRGKKQSFSWMQSVLCCSVRFICTSLLPFVWPPQKGFLRRLETAKHRKGEALLAIRTYRTFGRGTVDLKSVFFQSDHLVLLSKKLLVLLGL